MKSEWVARYAWQAYRDGGQTIGNLEEIRPYERGMYASYLSQDGGRTWRLFRVREHLHELMPRRSSFRKGWVIAVHDFDDPEVRKHIS